MRAEIDRESWSEESKRSYAYGFNDRFYSDIERKCAHCSTVFVFLGETQKQIFELEKRYIWFRPRLCVDCHLERSGLREQARYFQQSWNENRALKSDRGFLLGWLHVLECLPNYTEAENVSMISTLKKHIGALDV